MRHTHACVPFQSCSQLNLQTHYDPSSLLAFIGRINTANLLSATPLFSSALRLGFSLLTCCY